MLYCDFSSKKLFFSDGRIPTKLKYGTTLVIVVLLVAHVLLHYLSDFPYPEYSVQMDHLAELVHAEIGLTEIRFSSFTPAVKINYKKLVIINNIKLFSTYKIIFSIKKYNKIKCK